MRTLPRHQSLDDFPLPVLRGQPFIYDFWHHESIRVFTRSRSISSFVTIAPLRAKGRKPRKASLAVPPFEVPFASVRPRRASSERIRPAVLCSRRANSLAACRTSSSISRVVLIHLMIKHQTRRKGLSLIQRFKTDWPCTISSYSAARAAVEKLLAIDATVIRRLRERQPALYLLQPEELLTAVPGLSPDLASALCERFIR